MADWLNVPDELSEESIDALKHPEFGVLNFEGAARDLGLIRQWAQSLGSQPRELVYTNLQNECTAHLKNAATLASQIQNFRLDEPNSPQQRQALLTQIEREKDWWAQAVTPYLRLGEVDVAELQRAAAQAAEDARNRADEADEILQRMRRLSGEAGASTLSAHYHTQASHHEDQAQRFFVAGAVALAATFILGILVFVAYPPTIEETDNWLLFVRSFVPRLFLVGIAAYVVAFCGRNYRINKHLEVIHQQKRTALDTYPVFVESVTDDATRGMIAIELLRATVGMSDTGYTATAAEKTILETQPGIAQILRPPPGT